MQQQQYWVLLTIEQLGSGKRVCVCVCMGVGVGVGGGVGRKKGNPL